MTDPPIGVPPGDSGATVDPPSVSVVIATYQRPALVTEAVKSALDQGSMVKEVIVIDDCPSASAAEAMVSISDSRVSYYANPEPSGGRPGIPRNIGWRRATGSIVHFLDDDDLVPAGHYGEGLAALAREPDIGVVFGRIEPFGEDTAQVSQQAAFFEDAARRARARSRWGARVGFAVEMTFNPVLYVGGAALVRRGCIAALGGFDPTIHIIEDTDFFARLMYRFGARFLDRPALRYRIGPSITRSPSIQGRVREGYERMHQNCRGDWGRLRFLSGKIMARTVFRQNR